jgi:hypothetical protein
MHHGNQYFHINPDKNNMNRLLYIIAVHFYENAQYAWKSIVPICFTEQLNQKKHVVRYIMLLAYNT